MRKVGEKKNEAWHKWTPDENALIAEKRGTMSTQALADLLGVRHIQLRNHFRTLDDQREKKPRDEPRRMPVNRVERLEYRPERPKLGAPRSLTAYLMGDPRPGRTPWAA